MARLSKEERAELEARLAADDEDDDDDEVEVGFPDGSYFRGKYRRAVDVAAARGQKLKAEPEPEGDAPKGGKAKGGQVVEGRRFGGRRIS